MRAIAWIFEVMFLTCVAIGELIAVLWMVIWFKFANWVGSLTGWEER